MAVLNTASISSTDDIMQAIYDFLTITLTNNWTGNTINTTTNVAGVSTGNLFVQFSWTGTTISISQSTATSTPAVFGGETGDSSFDSEAVFPITVTDAELWVFANETATATDRYAHCVVEFNRDGRYLHFGFGHIRAADKYFSWSGGAYKYGGEFNLSSNGDEPWSSNHRGPFLDSTHTVTGPTQNLPTMRADTLHNQDAASKWLAFTQGNPTVVDNTNDADGDPVNTGRAFGRYGPAPTMALFQDGSANSASINLIPILVCFSESDTLYMPLGNMPDVRVCNIGTIQPKDQITIGSDTWQFFPWGQKFVSVSPTVLGTRNMGCAYLVT